MSRCRGFFEIIRKLHVLVKWTGTTTGKKSCSTSQRIRVLRCTAIRWTCCRTWPTCGVWTSWSNTAESTSTLMWCSCGLWSATFVGTTRSARTTGHTGITRFQTLSTSASRLENATRHTGTSFRWVDCLLLSPLGRLQLLFLDESIRVRVLSCLHRCNRPLVLRLIFSYQHSACIFSEGDLKLA